MKSLGMGIQKVLAQELRYLEEVSKGAGRMEDTPGSIGFKLDREEYERWKALAAQEGRSLADEIRWLVRQRYQKIMASATPQTTIEDL